MSFSKKEMCLEILKLIKPFSIVNLGIGLPTLVGSFIDENQGLVLHSENGVLGVSGRPLKKDVSPTLINAGKETIQVTSGASFFDSSLSFAMIRGGHIDTCVLGGMEVDCEKNLANWMIPGHKVTGMGGAMDLVAGPKQVLILMEHFTKKRVSKLTKKCSLPLTGKGIVDKVVTEMGVFTPIGDRFIIEKLAPSIKKEDLRMEGLI